jgi:hypothetical protein
MMVLGGISLGCSSGSDDEGSGGTGAELTYCDVAPIFEAKCIRCHGTPPENNAPISLDSSDDFEKMYGGVLVSEAVAHAIDTDFMPPGEDWGFTPTPTPLTAEEKETLLLWVEGGAPSPDTCP